MTYRCETNGEIKGSWSRISLSSMFVSCNRLRCGKNGVPRRFGVGNALSVLREETRERSTMEGKPMEGSSWREKWDETMERDESEAAFDRKMSEIMTLVGSG